LLPALKANPTTDRRIEDAVQSSHAFRDVLEGKITAHARNGVVTLKGTVGDDAQKRLAESTANGVDGVTRVDNEIKVDVGAREGSDEWLAMKIRSMLLVKANVSLTHTKVVVKDGVVSLSGTAESTAQKDMTEAYVKEIAGVKAVRNELQVTGGTETQTVPGRARTERDNAKAGGKAERENLAEQGDDGSITAQIKYELFSHRSTSPIKTKVNTINGHVVLTGEAESEAEKNLATKLAQSVRGVESVDNKMTVKK
jgi:hyperosmotically inducible protein